MTFRTFFEAKEADMELIRAAVDKVEDRPFKDLFGDKDRFLVKVYNPDFTKNMKELDLDRDKMDLQKRTYDGVPLGPMFRKMIEDKRNTRPKMRDLFQKFLLQNPYTTEALKKELATSTIFVKDPDTLVVARKTGNKYQRLVQIRDNQERSIGIIKRNFWKPGPLSISLDELLYKLFILSDEDFDPRINRMDEFRYAVRFYKEAYLKEDPAAKIKQAIDQNNVFYYLLFTRHPIDVLRMSDHKGVSSCHRLDGGMYKHCAVADAQNDGGVIYLIKGSDGQRAKSRLEEKEIFEDANRKVDGLRPLGRTRLRRFIDLQTGDDFAVLARLSGQFGTFTEDLWDTAHAYVRKNQPIFNNPPEAKYATANIIMVGGTYTDNISPSGMLNKFFGEDIYEGVQLRGAEAESEDEDGGNWTDELMNINDQFADIFREHNVSIGWVIRGEEIEVNLFLRTFVPFTKISELVGNPGQSGFDPANPDHKQLRHYIVDNDQIIRDHFWAEFELDNVTVSTGAYPSGVIIDTHYQTNVNDPHDIHTACEVLEQNIRNKDTFVDELFANWALCQLE